MGLRAEQIRAALKLDVREMPRVLKEGLVTKNLTSKGKRRGTTYFAEVTSRGVLGAHCFPMLTRLFVPLLQP
jgi:hypothetical protein